MDVPIGATGEDEDEEIGAETREDKMLGFIKMQEDKIWDNILAVLGRRSFVITVGKEGTLPLVAQIGQMRHEGVHKLCEEVEPGGDSLGGLS